MKQEIIEVIKKYIEVDESAIDVRLTNKQNTDGTTGAPALYANIPIVNIKQEAKAKENKKEEANEQKEIIKEAKQIIEDTTESKKKTAEKKKPKKTKAKSESKKNEK